MTTSLPIDEAAEAFTALAELVYAGETTFQGVYDAICRIAVSAVPGCDHACITTMRAGERTVCVASTDDIARRVDDLEWETQQGPCLDAILSQNYEWDPDITKNAAWPELARRTLDETPVRGMLGYRILVGGRKAAALNLLSDTPDALTEEAARIGAIVAAFATVALTAASEHEGVNTLRAAVDSNREIGKAVGLLMATHGLSDDDAFDMLREASSKLNLRLAEVARRVVEQHNDDAGPDRG